MLGDHIGELNVYVKQGFTYDFLWSKNHTQGDMWHKAQIQLSPMVDSYQVHSAKYIKGARWDTTMDKIL